MMISHTIVMSLLFAVSISFGSEPLDRITFGQGATWSITIYSNGSADFLYGSTDRIDAPPGSFNLKSIDAELGPLVTTNPGLEKGVKVYSSLRTGTEVKDAYYTENIECIRDLVKKVFEKCQIMCPESFDRWLERCPPLGVQLYIDETQIPGLDHYTGSPLRLRKPPSWLSMLNKRYALSDKIHPVALELFSTPWPYLALLVLLGMVVRRIRLKRRTACKLIPDARQ